MSFTESWLEGPQRTQFYTRLYKPQTKPVVALVFIHGFAEHIGRYTPFHSKLMERGILIFTFDQRGFGKTAMDKKNKSPNSSYGKTSWDDQLADIVWAIEHVTKETPSLSVFLAGHSMVLSLTRYIGIVDNIFVGRRGSLGIRDAKYRLATSGEIASAVGHYRNEPFDPSDQARCQANACHRRSTQQGYAKRFVSHTVGLESKYSPRLTAQIS